MNPTSDHDKVGRVLELIRGSSSADEMSRFGRRGDWSSNSRLGRAGSTFLFPHSSDYFSILKPVFLHQLKGVDVLTAYSPVLLRDGAVGLLDLFFRHSEPPMDDTFIFVHRDLAWTVPESWKNATAYYRVLPDVIADRPVQDLYLILSAINERQCSIADLQCRLEHIRRKISDGSYRVHVTVLPAHVFGTNPVERDTRSGIIFEMIRAIVAQFGEDIEHVSWTELQKRNLRSSRFVEFNPRRFYYADSFVSHHFLGKGALPLEEELVDRDEMELPISLFHKYALSVNCCSFDESRLVEVRKEWNDYARAPLFRREVRSFRKKKAFVGSRKFCAPALEALADCLASKIADANRCPGSS